MNTVKRDEPKSAYFLVEDRDREIRTTFCVLVDNEAGVLARVVGLFAGRGYNIESLTVAEVDHLDRTSRITIVTSGTPAVLEQIRHQLERLVPVHKVFDLTAEHPGIERELALVKVAGTGAASARRRTRRRPRGRPLGEKARAPSIQASLR